MFKIMRHKRYYYYFSRPHAIFLARGENKEHPDVCIIRDVARKCYLSRVRWGLKNHRIISSTRSAMSKSRNAFFYIPTLARIFPTHLGFRVSRARKRIVGDVKRERHNENKDAEKYERERETLPRQKGKQDENFAG